MGRFRLRLALLLLAQILVLQAMAEVKPFELKTQTEVQPHEKSGHGIADQPVSGVTVNLSEEEGEHKVAEAPEIRRLGKHHYNDKSMAGGGVIIGGLVTAIFAAVFCYIRVTRKRDPNY